MLAWFSNTLGGGYYLIGLIFYALLFKLVFLPFTIKQQKNQIAMAKLTPKIELIKAKYRGRTDQPTMQKMQQEIMELQQSEGYNPLSGCLPLLIQLPIITFLYAVIRKPLSYICQFGEDEVVALYKLVNDGAESAFKSIDQIQLVSKIRDFSGDLSGYDLSRLPDFTFFGVGDLGATPSSGFSLLWLIPIIAAFLTWLSMALSKKWNSSNNIAQEQQQAQSAQAEASMKMMNLMMPAMTLILAFTLSGMMGIYWIYQSLLGILQTYIISKAMPLPKYTEEDLKAMKKAQKQAEKAQRQAMKGQPKYRSLHYIDADDYDTLPEIKSGDNKKKNDKNLPDIKN